MKPLSDLSTKSFSSPHFSLPSGPPVLAATPWAARPRHLPRPLLLPAPDARASRLLATWVRAIAAQHQTPTAEIAGLSDEALVFEIGAVWRGWLIARANATYALGKKERSAAHRRLARSDDDDDRYVASLLDKWSRA